MGETGKGVGGWGWGGGGDIVSSISDRAVRHFSSGQAYIQGTIL